MAYSITLNGECAKHLCTINDKLKYVTTNYVGLVYDFNIESGWKFNTQGGSHFITHEDCQFFTGEGCTFTTGAHCSFSTISCCTFNTLHSCDFNVGYGCSIKTGYDSTLKVGTHCTLTRYDVYSFYKLPSGISCKVQAKGVRGLLINTQEYVRERMHDENGVVFLLKQGEWFDPWQDDLGEDFRYDRS